MKHVLVALLTAYRAVISPLYGQVCRYYPSCSAYALEAVQVHGSITGSWLALRRLARCYPWAAGGVDKVPPRATRTRRSPTSPVSSLVFSAADPDHGSSPIHQQIHQQGA